MKTDLLYNANASMGLCMRALWPLREDDRQDASSSATSDVHRRGKPEDTLPYLVSVVRTRDRLFTRPTCGRVPGQQWRQRMTFSMRKGLGAVANFRVIECALVLIGCALEVRALVR